MELDVLTHDYFGDPLTVETVGKFIWIEGDPISIGLGPDEAIIVANALIKHAEEMKRAANVEKLP